MTCYDELRRAFLQPDAEFSPLPFWFWNDDLSEAELTRQIDDFAAHGVMGFVLHPRKGLPGSIPYLSETYLHYVRHAVDEAARRGMRVVLYDEGMYPSGAAHGMVVAENPAYASRCLWMEVSDGPVAASDDIVAVCAVAEDRRVIQPVDGVYPLPEEGPLYVFREGFSGGTIRGVHENEDDGECHAPKSADLLNPDAVRAFIRLTHARYYAALPDHFGKTVIAMFTDEPDIVGRNARTGSLAWTRDFLPEFGDPCDLPALFLDTPDAQGVRRRYRRAVNHRMLTTYYQPLADWCEAHGIALTGHPAKSWDIGLLQPFQLPGQDLVWRYVTPGQSITGVESVLGKCAVDSARHHGRRRIANECFGCCGPAVSQWAMTAADMKWMMDYLFVRGTNLLYPHAFYYSVRDGRGDERPPDVGPNNTWWPEYPAIATYMRRLSWLMTDSVDQSRVAVLCEEDHLPWEPCVPLYEGQIGFSYLEHSLLPECRIVDNALCIGMQKYTHVLVGDLPLTDAERAILADFTAAGGVIVKAGTALPRVLRTSAPVPDLRMAHVVKGGLHFFLLTNEGTNLLRTALHAALPGRAQWWDAWTGEITDTLLPAELILPPCESRILVIDPEGTPASSAWTEPPLPVRLQGPAWRLTREDSICALLIPDEAGRLPGWQTLPGWETYSGWVAYEAETTIAPGTRIDLGEVHEMARVYADGKLVGTRLWGPYCFDLPHGATHLRIEVANTPAGKMDGVSLESGMLN